MAIENILQHEVLTSFLYPFLLVFFILFAVLEKTQLFGKEKKQINAFVAFIIGLIFVSAVAPKLILGDLILFLTIGIVIVFVVLLLWGFINGEEAKFGGKGVKIISAIAVLIAVFIAVLFITDSFTGLVDILFGQSWSKDLWVNVVFILVLAGAIAAVLVGTKYKKS